MEEWVTAMTSLDSRLKYLLGARLPTVSLQPSAVLSEFTHMLTSHPLTLCSKSFSIFALTLICNKHEWW